MTERDLPETLSALFAAERAAPLADLATPALVRAKLDASIGTAPLGAATATKSALLAAKVLMGIALVVGVGAIATRTRTQASRPAPVAAVVTPMTETPTLAPIAPPPELVAPEEPMPAAPPVRPAAVHRPKTAPRVAIAAEPVPSQTELLRDAWSAMATGDAKRALALVLRDEQLHPRGALDEERDALEVEALARLRRFDEARSARDKFLARYPSSIHRTRVRAIGAEETSR